MKRSITFPLIILLRVLICSDAEATNNPEEFDMSDADGDGIVGRQEFRAGTNPTNKDSVFKVMGFALSNGTSTIKWHGGNASGAQLVWNMYRSTNLLNPNEWVPVASNIPCRPVANGVNTWSTPVTNASTGAGFFYKPMVKS